jgi:formylglycine-generating enzyme required for sulfatase activity
MSYDVFLSYSSRDKNVADAACAVLERSGIRCWIAPRDVTPGMVWSSAIVGAIQGAKVMVLVFSGAANHSPQIAREVERAISKGLPVIPFRIEEVQPSDSLEYFISASHWLDAFTEPLEQHLEMLANVVQRLIEVKQNKAGGEGIPANREGTGATAAFESATEALARPPNPVAPVSPSSTAALQQFAANPASATANAHPTRSRWPLAIAAIAAIAVSAGLAAVYFTWTPHSPALASRHVGEVFRDCPDCPEMVVVPAGRFMMGASQQEQSVFDWARASEQPVHEVRIAKPFAVGVFAITRDEFEDFVRRTNTPEEGGCNYWDSKEVLDPTRSFRDPKLSGGPQAGDHPVVCVSTQEAIKFTAWLSGRTGRNYRLLSDAEREYVTRARTTSAFWWGPSISPDQANYWSDSPYKNNPTAPARWTTLPVKFFKPNPWGLYQVHGNVTELVADCWHPSYEGVPSDGSAWQPDPGVECKGQTMRGGSFMNGADLLRSAHRRGRIEFREISVGFRVAQTLAD